MRILEQKKVLLQGERGLGFNFIKVVIQQKSLIFLVTVEKLAFKLE